MLRRSTMKSKVTLPAALARWPARWSTLERRFLALSARERLLVSVGSAAAVLMLLDPLWLTPSWRQWTAARQAHQQAESVLATLGQDSATLRQRQDEQERQLRAELAALQTRVAQAEAAGQARDLVPPSQMLPLLETLLGRHHGLKVRSLQSLGRTVLGDGTPTIYRHGVELTVEGRYADLLAYLRALEQSPQRLLWGTLQLRVEQHPNVLMTLRLHTLSTDAHWVEI